MAKSIESTVDCLKGMIDRNGPSYLADEPYEVFKELMKAGAADRKRAAAILHVLVSGAARNMDAENDAEALSEKIQKGCGLNKRTADEAAVILHSLYSNDHKKEWEGKELEGLKQFLAEDFTVAWKGYAVWDNGGGTVGCHYEAEIVLAPEEAVAKDKELAQKLKKNPFMTKEEIYELFSVRLKKYLDAQFDEYCTEDDYYQPVVEDFGGNLDYDLSDWCGKNGFEIVSCDGDGDDDGFEPKFRRGWY